MVGRSVYIFTAIALMSISLFSQTAPLSQSDKEKVTPASSFENAKSRIDLIDGKVIAVSDGDTITIQSRGRNVYTVRLQGIDAPENKQEYFRKSRKNLAEMILDKDVKVVVHKRSVNDLYIGSVYLKGIDVGLIQVEKGMAWHFKHFAYEQTAEARKRYAQAQAQAMAERLGLWEDPNPTAPWIFRGDSFTTEVRNIASVPTPGTPVSNERKYILGPRGGCYYIGDSGSKVYVKDKSLCGIAATATKP